VSDFGVCVGPEQAGTAARAGFDFIECTVSGSLNPLAGPERFVQTQHLAQEAGMPVAAFNCFVPAQLKMTGPEADMSALEDYVTTAFDRAAGIGAAIVVFGSGGARHIPEGFPREEAWGQLVRFLDMAGPEAERNDVTIAIEPLAAAECNIINSVAEAVRLADEVNHPAVRVLADIFHMTSDEEPYSALGETRDLLVHVHVADPVTRVAPRGGSTHVLAFFKALQALGYSGRVSVECAWDDFESQAARALTDLKELWRAASD